MRIYELINHFFDVLHKATNRKTETRQNNNYNNHQGNNTRRGICNIQDLKNRYHII